MHHCCTFPGVIMDQHAGVDYLVLLCKCVISILIRKLMIVHVVEVRKPLC